MIADEVTGKSTTEQISICVRFVGKDSNGELCLKESFVCFAEASSTSGEYIAQKIVDKFNEFGLVIDNLRGQGYNGAGHMAGTFSAQIEICSVTSSVTSSAITLKNLAFQNFTISLNFPSKCTVQH
jgi:hypothetical protein